MTRLQRELVKHFINMKKLLGIVVLGLLLSGNAYANIFYLNCDREIYENNGSGDWSLYYKVGNSADGSILIKISPIV